MRLTSLLLLTPLLVSAMPEASRERSAEVDARDALNARDLNPDLTKRACKDVGCKCKSGHGGVWCANCMTGGTYVVTTLGSGSVSDVYQCSSSGGCCDFGYASDCKDGATGRCG